MNNQSLLERYIAVWNETDAARRRAAIEALFTPEGAHLSAAFEARGYDALEARVSHSNRRWVVEQEFMFQATGEVFAHHDAVAFTWEMLPRDGGDVESLGQEFILLASDGRVREAYQFILQ